MYEKDDSLLGFLSSMYEMLPSVYLTMRPSCPVETRNVGQLKCENNNLDQPIYEKIGTTVEIDGKDFYDSEVPRSGERRCNKELAAVTITISLLIIGETR